MPNILIVVPSEKEKLPLSVTHPELAKEADGWDSSSIMPVSRYLNWVCNKGHSYRARIYDRLRGRGCSICTGKRILSGETDLAATHPKLAAQAHKWDPSRVSAGSHLKKEWLCPSGHLTISIVKNRALLGNDCPVCVNQQVLEGYNDLGTLFPEIASTLVGSNPSKIIPGSNKKYSWICPIGHEFIQSVNQRVNGQGCNICAGKKILQGFNDLATTHPEVANEAYGWNPAEVFGGTHSRKPFKCSEGHTYSATVKDRTISGSGCPVCSKHGFNPGKSGFLYFLEHPNWEMLQIGITNDIDTRMYAHGLLGWHCVEYRGPMDAQVCREWETAILRMLKAKGADLSNENIAGKFDGYSEAWSKFAFEVKSIKELMHLTEEYEEK